MFVISGGMNAFELFGVFKPCFMIVFDNTSKKMHPIGLNPDL